MQFATHDLSQLTETTWHTVFGQDLTPTDEAGTFASYGDVAASVDIGGTWTGRLVITFSTELARQATASMFDVSPSDADSELVRDALGEIANIIGGGVKALVGGECFLSLPAFAEGASNVQVLLGGEILNHVGFLSAGQRFEVTLLGQTNCD